MFTVGVRCELLPSTREANSYFEEEMASTIVEEKLVDAHFCQWLVSISFGLHLIRKQYFEQKYQLQVRPRALDRLGFRFAIRVELQNNPMVSLSSGVKLTIKDSSGTIRGAYVHSAYFDESLAFLTNVAFLCQTLSCSCQRALVFNSSLGIHLFLVYSLLPYTLVCSLPSFYRSYFQGLSARQEEIKSIQSKRMKTKLRI